MILPYKAEMELPDGKKTEWDGFIQFLTLENGILDFWINARSSSFHCIVGRSSSGNYICLPDQYIGTGLAALNDCYWNREHLQYAGLCPVDAASLSYALEKISCLL